MKLKVLGLILVCMFLFSSPFITNAQETEQSCCGTAEELFAFISGDTGGTVSLTEDIVWDYGPGIGALYNITKPVRVEMGQHKITIPAECSMQIEGPVTFQGNGSVLLENNGLLDLSYGVEIIAAGANAVALDINEESSVNLLYSRIAATGQHATAITSDLPVGQGDVIVQLCNISGTRTSIQAPSVTLDGTTASPLPQNADIIERIPVVDRSMRLYGISLPVDTSWEEYREAIYGLDLWNFAFIDPASGNTIGLSLPSIWKNVPEYPAALGSHILTLKPKTLPEWFPVRIPEFSIPLHIVEHSVPHITVMYGDPMWGFVLMSFTNPDSFSDAEKITLFYSVDGGNTWRDVTEDFAGAAANIYTLSAEPLTPETNYLFYAEVTSGGKTKKSNILYYPNVISDLDVDYSYGGGDRDEDDFGDQGEEPPSGSMIPPPQDEPEQTPVLRLEEVPASTPTTEVEEAPEQTPIMEVEEAPEQTPIMEPEAESECKPAKTAETEKTSEPSSISETEKVSEPVQILESETDSEVSVFANGSHLAIVILLAAVGIATTVYLWNKKGGRS